jgi:hypothetical protein
MIKRYIYYCISYPNFNGAKSESEDREIMKEMNLLVLNPQVVVGL